MTFEHRRYTIQIISIILLTFDQVSDLNGRSIFFYLGINVAQKKDSWSFLKDFLNKWQA